MAARVAESTPGRRRALLALAAAKRRNKARVKHGEQPVIAGKRVKISTYVRKYGKPKTAEAMPFGPEEQDEEVDILDREDVETAVGLVVELDSDPDDLRGYVAERARDLGHVDLIPREWGATRPVLTQRQAEVLAAPVAITESIPGLAYGYDATGYSIGHLNSAYRPDASDPSLLAELRAIATRLDEAMEVVDNASVVATYRANLEKRIRAGIVAKATIANDGHAPDPSSVELAYQRHFAMLVPGVVEKAAAVLGKHPVSDPDDLVAEFLDDEDPDDTPEGVSEAGMALGKSEDAPKYIFGRLNKAWKPKDKSTEDRLAKRTALMQKMHDLWSKGAKRGDAEWDQTVNDLRATETLAERRSRYLAQMDRIAKATAAGRTENARGESYEVVNERLRARLKQVQKAMRAKGIAYQSASPKSGAAVPPKSPRGRALGLRKGSGMKSAASAAKAMTRPRRQVSEATLSDVLRSAESRLAHMGRG